MIPTFDRYLVSSWGRAGSTIITQATQQHLQCFTEKPVEWRGAGEIPERGWNSVTGYPSLPWSVIHSHSLVQFNTIEKMAVIICLRNPGEQALSQKLSVISGYRYVYKPCVQQQAAKVLEQQRHPHEYFKMVIQESENYKKPQNFWIDCLELEQNRHLIIDWNDLACARMQSQALGLVYDEWRDNLQFATDKMNISLNFDSLTMLRNPINLLDRVENREEVHQWLQTHQLQHQDMVHAWKSMLLDRF